MQGRALLGPTHEGAEPEPILVACDPENASLTIPRDEARPEDVR
jgi:hypothetical protein